MDLITVSDPLTRAQKLSVVSKDDVKRAAKVRHADEDQFIEDQIVTAFDYLHGYQGWTNGYYLLEEEVCMYADGVDNLLEVPARPFLQATALTFGRLGADGQYAPVASADYAIAVQDECAVIASLSATAFRRPAGIVNPRSYQIRCKVGHADPKDVPQSLRSAMILLVTHWYRNREATRDASTTTTVDTEIQFGVKALAGRYRFSLDHS